MIGAPTLAAIAVVAAGGPLARVACRPPLRRPEPSQPTGADTEPDRNRRRRRRRIIGLVSLGVIMTVVAGPVAAALLAAGAALSVRLHAVRVGRRRRRRAERDLPDAVERLILTVHAGLSPHLAVRSAVDDAPRSIRPGFETVVHRLDRGVPLADALTALPQQLGPRAAPVADAFAAADRYGLPLEPMLHQLATDARAERRRLDEADARRLPVRLSMPLVLCTLPSFVLVAIAPAVLAALSSLGGSAW